MGAKDELRRLFIGDGETTISGIPEFPGDLIAYALQTFEAQNNSIIFAGKSLEFEVHALPVETRGMHLPRRRTPGFPTHRPDC